MAIDEETLLARIVEHGTFRDSSDARTALQATLAALRRGLTDREAQGLADDLGVAWAEPLRRGCYQGALPLEEFYRLAAPCDGRRLPVAAGHARAVCRALSELIPAAACARLCRQLPELSSLFANVRSVAGANLPIAPEAACRVGLARQIPNGQARDQEPGRSWPGLLRSPGAAQGSTPPASQLPDGHTDFYTTR